MNSSLFAHLVADPSSVHRPSPHELPGSTVLNAGATRMLGADPNLALPDFQFVKQIATGAMSRVYLAVHRTTRERFAIKAIHLAGPDSSVPSRTEREWHILSGLRHPHIVRGHGCARAGNSVYMILELVDGTSLDRLVEECGRLAAQPAAQAVLQAARGLGFAHARGIVHRDVKPSNLLIEHSGRVKVIDFGMARLEWPGQESITLDYDDTLLGTVNFMAPEQATACHEVDARADLYSLGCTLYFLLAGRAPFPEGSLAVRLQKHREEAPTPLSIVAPHAPRSLTAICDRLMAKTPGERYASASELVDVLEDWLSSAVTV